ncbi:MAG: BCR, YceG family protein, partial [Porticoccus sp.]|nr:BCR, YceG family protein [Porticoccus sp.]
MLRLLLRWLLVLIVGVPFCVYIGAASLKSYLDTPLNLQAEEQIEVPAGMSLTRLANQLADQGLLTLPQLFTAYARLTDQTAIRVGEYQLDAGINP